jgi:hypothetical protein
MVASDRPRGRGAAVDGVGGFATVAAWLKPARAAMRAQARKESLILRDFNLADG